MKHKRIVTVLQATELPDASPAKLGAYRRVAAYARVSSNSEEQLNSYEAQKDYYTRFINAHTGWICAGIYSDEGLSGTSSKSRPAFNQMISDAVDGKIDLIITKSISRFARNTLDSLTAIRKLKSIGCEVWFEKENLYSFDSKGEFILTLMSSIAQEESRSLSENVKWGVRKRFSDGKYSLPYAKFLGYKRGKDGKPEIVPEEAIIIRLIYRLYLEGETMSGIAQYLIAQGIETPGGKECWQRCVIKSILTNEKYYGAALMQKRFVEDFLTKKTRQNTGELPQYFVKDDHMPIVSEAVFMEVQRRIEITTHHNPRLHLFSNKLICGTCGGKYGSKLAGGYKEPRPSCTPHIIWYCNEKYKKSHDSKMPTLSNNLTYYLFASAVQLIWAKHPVLLKMLKKSIATISPGKGKVLRRKGIIAFLKKIETMYPLEFTIDTAAVQVLLDYAVVSHEKTVVFHFCNSECVVTEISNQRKRMTKILGWGAANCDFTQGL